MDMPTKDEWVQVSPTDLATARTRTRIEVHGPDFILVKIGVPVCFKGAPAGFFLSREGWFGWLPLAHIDLKKLSPPSSKEPDGQTC